MRGIFGDILRRNPISGRKISKREIKRDVIAENRCKGRDAEQSYRTRAQMAGYEVERTGRGHDFKIRKRDPLTGKVIYTGYREIKSGNAKPSKLQNKVRRNKSNYRVIREDNPFW